MSLGEDGRKPAWIILRQYPNIRRDTNRLYPAYETEALLRHSVPYVLRSIKFYIALRLIKKRASKQTFYIRHLHSRKSAQNCVGE
jgi:hypothetical protein